MSLKYSSQEEEVGAGQLIALLHASIRLEEIKKMARKSQVTGAIQGTKPLYEYELLLEGGTWVPVTDSRDPVELEAFIKVQQGGGSWVRLIMQGGKEEFVGDWAAVKGFRFARKETPAFGVSNEG